MKKFLLIPFLFACFFSVWDANAQCTAFSGSTDPLLGTPTLTASAQSSSAIQLTWVAGLGGTSITGYDIYRASPASSTTFCFIGSTAAATLQYMDTGAIIPVMSYAYRVYAKSAAGFSGPGTASATTPIQLNPPSNVVATPVAGRTDQIQVSWTDNSTNESGFQVFITNAAGSTETLVGTTAFPTFIVPNLTPNTTYYFKVKAYVLNPSPTPPTYSAGAMSNAATTFVNPGMPANLVVFPIGFNTATVNWDDNSTDEVRFEIVLNQQTIPVPAFTGTGRRSFELTNLFPKNNYSVYIRAIGPGNTRAELLPSVPFVTCPAPPPTPFNLAIPANDMASSATISWGIIGGFDDLSIIEIERSTDGGASWVRIATQNRLLQTYTDNTASGGTRYMYRIIAVNTCGYKSNPSAPIAFQRTAPVSVYELSATAISDKQIDLAWGLPAEGATNKRTAIEIWRKAGDNANFERLTIIEPFFFSYVDKNVLPKTKYTYFLAVTNVIGATNSPQVVATTFGPPDTPHSLKVTPTTDNLANSTFFISWQHAFEDEDFFTLEESVDGGPFTELQRINRTVTSLTRIPIEEGVKYTYRVRGWNKWGYSEYSNNVDATFDATKAPNAPFNLKAKAISASEIQLTWLDDANSESAFEVEASSDGKVFRKIAETKRNIVTYSDKNLAEKTKFTYRVRATNAKGNSDYTNIAEATTLAKTSAFVENIDINIFPNPTNDYTLLKISEEVKGVKNVIVVDRNSRVVMKSTLADGQNELMLNMTTLMEGTYTVTIMSDTGKVTKRIAKF